MKSRLVARGVIVAAMATALGGCATWHDMPRENGTVTGAIGGVAVGALVGGPIGAVVGGLGGAYLGYETTGKATQARTSSATPGTYDASTIRSVQQELNKRGYNAGPANGQWNSDTQTALRRFQETGGMPATGDLSAPTLLALGVS